MSATNLTNEILLEISRVYGRGACVQRINVIAARAVNRDGATRFVRSARAGTGDTVGVIAGADGIGRAVMIEVKSGRDRMSPIQCAFRDAWGRAGGIFIEGRSVEQVMTELAEKLGEGSGA